ncbi:hypothetical protein [Burkholderia thailandensis]|uniref:hypothetical protein n=1 Tax=Burkholderia thailandensis TaxID=57975 RepID=UPI0009B59E5C|nr:hypothetical protein [Burkholderia thailandensis]AVR08649.1 hypothetical protein A8H31_13875 [Burkholderia thailandensis]AWY58623.1 hypothetical protein A8H35_09505 [Burkholderia thailandensis]AWY67211.1 hypothetical protein A8H36_18935 [Burkholderia thailandensis]MCS3396058.1 hypothetical protein [Burkholderia thailandensis]MCS6468476.1 hypothetical protein [Burkholderia thailandensis]
MAGLHALGRHVDRSGIEVGGARKARRAPLPPIIRASARAVKRLAHNLWENRSFCDIPSSCTDEHRSHFQARLPDHR